MKARLVAALLLGSAGSVQAATFTLNAATCDANGNGTCCLPQAVTAVNNQTPTPACAYVPDGGPDIILVPAGTFTVTSQMEINRSVSIRGAGVGVTQVRANLTGDGPFIRVVNVGDFSQMPLTVWFESVDIDNISSTTEHITGIYAFNSTVYLQDARVAMFTLTGVYGQDSDFDIRASAIENNSNLSYGGGGVRFEGINRASSLTIGYSTIANNVTVGDGGGVFVTGSGNFVNPATIAASVIASNDAVFGKGGGAYFETGTQGAIIDSTIASNHAGQDGGGVAFFDPLNSILVRGGITGSLLVANTAANRGGGVSIFGAEMFGAAAASGGIENSTFSGNTGTLGGGGLSAEGAGEFHMRYCTVANNSAPQGDGGGILGNFSTPVIWFNIFADNGAAQFPDARIINLELNGDYNLIEDVTNVPASQFPAPPQGHCIRGVDPGLDVLQIKGGATAVHPLKDSSVALDRIPASVDSFVHDQRGTLFVRPLNGNDGAGRNGADIGAYEQNPLQMETESLTAVATSPGINHVAVTDSDASADRYTTLQATAAGQFVVYRTPSLSSGARRVIVRLQHAPDGGMFEVGYSNSRDGPFINLGSIGDTFSATPGFAEWAMENTMTITTSGQQFFRFSVAGSAQGSTGFRLSPDFIMLR
jgi:hypothetical protein